VRFSGATARVVGTVDSQIEQELGGKFGAYGSAGDANNAIYNAGNGAQGVVSASGATGGGHYFNIVNDNGNVRLLDGQTGAEISWSSFKPGTTFALLPVK
jgi:filamentous hemagglutinin